MIEIIGKGGSFETPITIVKVGVFIVKRYRLKKRLSQMTIVELQSNLENIADEIFDNKDNVICNKCHSGIIKAFEDRGGYSVRCDYCKAANYCRCETKERAIEFWIKGIMRV